VQTAAKAAVDVSVGRMRGKPVSAKSILSVLALDVRQGETIVITAEGEGADELLDSLAEIASAP
jgi:phosphocarrier protein